MTDQHNRISLRRLSLPHRPLPFAVAISPPTTEVPLPEREYISSSVLAATMNTKRQEGNGKEYVIMPKLRLPTTFPELAARGEAEHLVPVTMRNLTHMDTASLPLYSAQMASPGQKQTSISSSILTLEFSLEAQKQKSSRQFLGKPDHLGGAYVVVKVMVVETK